MDMFVLTCLNPTKTTKESTLSANRSKMAKGHRMGEVTVPNYSCPKTYVVYQTWSYDLTMLFVNIGPQPFFLIIKIRIIFKQIHEFSSKTNKNTIDGSEIRRSPVEVGSLSHYSSQVFLHPNGGCLGFLAINSSTLNTFSGIYIASFEAGFSRCFFLLGCNSNQPQSENEYINTLYLTYI